MVKHIFTLFVFLINEVTSEELMCDTVKGKLTEVQWPATNTSTLSSPPCVDESKELVYRKCLDGKWDTEPKCFYIQQTVPTCPDGFFSVGKMCYMFTTETTFPPKCPSDNVLPFDSYKYVVPATFPIWMPVTRDLSNGFGFMQWVEPSPLYKTPFSNYVMPRVDPNNNNCIVYYTESYMAAVPCDQKYTGVCAYSQDQWTNSINMCTSMDHCVPRNFFDSSRCFCVTDNSTGTIKTKADFVTLIQNRVYNTLTGENCTFGLEKFHDKYVWSNSLQEINYTYWSRSAVFDENLIYGAVSPDGWILTEQPLSCLLTEVDAEYGEPMLDLHYSDVFELKITNFRHLKLFNIDDRAFCFTNAHRLNLLYRYDSLQTKKTTSDTITLTFEPLSEEPGHYWCEAFRLSDTKLLKSNTIFYQPNHKYKEFVATWKVHYYKTADPGSNATTSIIGNVFENLFSKEQSESYTPRIMKLHDLNLDTGTLLAKIHITSVSFMKEESDAKNIEIVMRPVLDSEEKVDMVSLSSAQNCFDDLDGGLIWPRTPLGSEAFPNEFCFSKDATRVSRMCSGNFIDGAHWSKYEECEVFHKSNITTEILDLLDQNVLKNNTYNQIYDISRRYNDFTSLDIYVVGNLYSNVSLIGSSHESLFKILNNLLNIDDKKVLIDSQIKMKATKYYLDYIQNLLLFPSDFNFGGKNFVLKSLRVSAMKGMQVLESDVKIFSQIPTIDEMLKIENLKSAIWLSSELSDSEDKVMFSLFFDNVLFYEINPSFQKIGNVFGFVQFSVLSNATSIFVLHRLEEDTAEEACLYWDSESHPHGFWVNLGTPRRYQSFVLCQFQQNGFFTVGHTPKKSDNVTEELINVLHSHDPPSVKVEKLSHISEKYREFKPIDVSCVGRILSTVRNVKDINLRHLAKIVSNMHGVKRNFLSESQLADKATDRILYNVDSIVKNYIHKHTVQVVTNNFAILVVDLEQTDFSGVLLFHRENSILVQILEGDDPIIVNKNFDSAMVLSSDLKKQLGTKGTVIVTIFSNDALFNEQNFTSKNVSTVFGVILPEIGDYAGPISITHKVETTEFKEQCAYWYYNDNRNHSSYWKKDSENESSSHFVKCEYWHTTHFALLLVEKDHFEDKSNDFFKFLDIITNINIVVSAVSLCCIVVTAVLFKQWRSNTGNQILLNFVFVLLFQNGVLYISGSVVYSSDRLLCTIVGVCLHYFTISGFCWMLVTAFLQYRRFVKVLDAPPKNVLLKACFCGWGFPLLPIVFVLFFDRSNYVADPVDICYPSGMGLYLGVWLPVSLILTTNSLIFIVILFNVVFRKTERIGNNNEAIHQLRLAVLLFFMFGLTWIFGLLSNLQAGGIFLYLFTITGTLQGFIIFLFFVVLNSSTRKMYVRAFKKYCDRSK